jgi:hypothetical protein
MSLVAILWFKLLKRPHLGHRQELTIPTKMYLSHRLDHRLQFLFNAILGFPGEGPPRLPSRGISFHPCKPCFDTSVAFRFYSSALTITPSGSEGRMLFWYVLPVLVDLVFATPVCATGKTVSPLEEITLHSMFKERVNLVIESNSSFRDKNSKLSFLRMLLPSVFMSFLAWSCCFPSWDAPEIYRHVLAHGTLDQGHRKNALLDHIVHNYLTDTAEFGPLIVNGRILCDKCFKGLFLVSDSEWRRVKADVRAGKVHYQHGNTGHAQGPTDIGLATRTWMTDHFFTVGDFQPGYQCSLLCPLYNEHAFYSWLSVL